MSSLDGSSDDFDDDDLILQLSTRPPRPTQSQVPSNFDSPANRDTSVTNKQGELESELIKAQGETSILRDKLNFLDDERKRERQVQVSHDQEIQNTHKRELDQLRLELQNLEDEKKFLLMEVRKVSSTRSRTSVASSYVDPSSSTDEATATENSSAGSKDIDKNHVKKRKIEESTHKNHVVITARAVSDEPGQLFDFIMTHKLQGVDLSTIEILNRLKLDDIEHFAYKNFRITKGESIGKSVVDLLLQCKKALTLDKFVDLILETFALFIKEITINKKESKIAVPFLVVLMYQTTIFRPSAVQPTALKDLLQFICDLIKAFQKVLKRPLHESTFGSDVEPQIYQYEFIDILVIIFSYDVLEISLRVLRSSSSSLYHEVLTPDLLKSIEHTYKLAVTSSYKPLMNVVFNAVEVLNLLSSMMMCATSVPIKLDSQWWKDCITRLYYTINRGINTYCPFQEENLDVFCFDKFHDIFGMIRNIGTNAAGRLIPRLIHEEKLQSLPRVILKDDTLEKDEQQTSHSTGINLESWLLQLKDNILNILENVIALFPDDSSIVNGEMLIQLTRFMSMEQELMMQRLLGQDSPNLSLHCHLIEHSLAVIYRLWMDHPKKLTSQNVKEIECELVTSLWRFVACRDHDIDTVEILENQSLVNEMGGLKIESRNNYYDDAFESMPAYMEEEVVREIDEQTSKIMQIKYGEVYQHMARTILECKLDTVVSLEGMDSLYVAMGK